MKINIQIENLLKFLTTESDDNRSYHINSEKIKKILGYTPQYTVKDAVEELSEAFIENKIPK